MAVSGARGFLDQHGHPALQQRDRHLGVVHGRYRDAGCMDGCGDVREARHRLAAVLTRDLPGPVYVLIHNGGQLAPVKLGVDAGVMLTHVAGADHCGAER